MRYEAYFTAPLVIPDRIICANTGLRIDIGHISRFSNSRRKRTGKQQVALLVPPLRWYGCFPTRYFTEENEDCKAGQS